MAASPVPCLGDIVQAIEQIRAEMVAVTLQAFEAGIRRRWLVERGIEIISEASRRPGILWRKVAGIGNILRHDYELVAHDILWHVVRDNLQPLKAVCFAELVATPRNQQFLQKQGTQNPDFRKYVGVFLVCGEQKDCCQVAAQHDRQLFLVGHESNLIELGVRNTSAASTFLVSSCRFS